MSEENGNRPNLFNWPRFRHSVLETKMIENTKIEDICTEMIFVERPTDLTDYNNSDTPTELITFMKNIMLEVQTIIPLFIGKCKTGAVTSIAEIEAFHCVLRRFCKNFSNQAIECNIGELHFYLNHLLAVIINIIGRPGETLSLSWTEKKWDEFAQNTNFMLNLA